MAIVLRIMDAWFARSRLPALAELESVMPATRPEVTRDNAPSLRNKFNSPGSDPRTPDIILKVNTGVIFTGGSKIAEHGGFNEDDVHTALLFSIPGLPAAKVATATTNQQVPATILQILGIDPNELQAVQAEQIHTLPFPQP